jgi:hypothetical protein
MEFLKMSRMRGWRVLMLSLMSISAHSQNIAISNLSQAEGNTGTTNFAFQITVNPTSAAPITVTFDTQASGSATAGSDFTAVAGRVVTIPANATSVTTAVAVTGETVVESNETFVVQLSAASAGTIVTNQALGTITNDDQAVLSVAAGSAPEGNATNTVSVQLNLSNPVQGVISVALATGDDSATAPQDYAPIVNQVSTFASTVTSQTQSLSIVGDNVVEANERLQLLLRNLVVPPALASSVSLSATPTFFTINNDDSTTLSVTASAQLSEGNSGSSAMPFALSLSAPSDLPVSVNFATSNGTATAGADYTASTGVATFAARQTSLNVDVPILGDTLLEGNESFNLSLSAPVIATLANAQSVGTIIDDDTVRFSINDVTALEGSSPSTVFAFTVTQTGASAVPINVSFQTQDGTARAPDDYQSTNGSLTFPGAAGTQTINVNVVGNSFAEEDETFRVQLASTAPGIVFDRNAGIGTILNDDSVTTLPLLSQPGIALLLILIICVGVVAVRRTTV